MPFRDVLRWSSRCSDLWADVGSNLGRGFRAAAFSWMRCVNELSDQSPVLQPSANMYSVSASNDPGSKFNRVRDIPTRSSRMS